MQQTIDRYAIAAFLPLALLAIATGLFTARRSNRSRVLLVLTCISIAAIISITIAGRMIKLSAWGYRGVHVDWLVDAQSWGNLVNFDDGSLLNLALFVPAGALLTWTTHRMWTSVVLLVALSLVIEITQRTWSLGAPDVRDIFANAVGAVVGSVGVGFARRRQNPPKTF